MPYPKLHECHYVLKNGEEVTKYEWPDIQEQLLDLVTGNKSVSFKTEFDGASRTFTIECGTQGRRSHSMPEAAKTDANNRDMLHHLHHLQDIRQHVYRLQEKVNTSTPLALFEMFEMLATLVKLCDKAIDLEIRL